LTTQHKFSTVGVKIRGVNVTVTGDEEDEKYFCKVATEKID